MEKTTLIKIADDALALNRQLIESGGELTPEIEARLNDIDLKTRDKIDAYQVVRERCRLEADYWKTKADELMRISRAHKEIDRRLTENIKKHMELTGTKEVEGHTVRFVLTKTGEELVIDDSLLPDAYKMQVTEWVPDKEKIRAALQDGVDVAGAELRGGFALRKYARKSE